MVDPKMSSLLPNATPNSVNPQHCIQKMCYAQPTDSTGKAPAAPCAAGGWLIMSLLKISEFHFKVVFSRVIII